MSCGLAQSIQQLTLSRETGMLLSSQVVSDVIAGYFEAQDQLVECKISPGYYHGSGRIMHEQMVWATLTLPQGKITIGIVDDGTVQVSASRYGWTGTQAEAQAICAKLSAEIKALLMNTADRMMALKVQQALEAFGMVDLDAVTVEDIDGQLRAGYEVRLSL